MELSCRQPFCSTDSGLKYQLKGLWAQPPYEPVKLESTKEKKTGEQDGKGVGGHGVHLSPQIYQEYSFKHRSACRTPADSGQEFLTSGKEHKEPHKLKIKP